MDNDTTAKYDEEAKVGDMIINENSPPMHTESNSREDLILHIQPTSDFQKVITDIEEINESEETSEQRHNATMNKQISEISVGQKTKSNYILEQLLRNCDDKF
jgi:hypothetical protein